jgi:hypothetical protein
LATTYPDDIGIISDSEIINTVSRTISSTQHDLVCLFDSKSLQVLTEASSTNAPKILSLRSRGVGFKCVTEITQSNLAQCKELMKNFDLFHLACLAGSFMVSDGREYLGYIASETGAKRLLQITNPSFVGAQVLLVNSIVDKALPAKQRLAEMVKGTANEFIETIRDPVKTRSLITDLIDTAIYEIAILFSTRNSFLMAEREGILDRLGQASGRGIKVKILVMKDETVREISDSKLKAPYDGIQVNYLQQFLPTKITTILVDQSKSLTIEVNDDEKETFQEAIGLSTYSNSESTVFSNASIFESLWIQSELDKQNTARQTYFQLFKGFKLKDEVYDRRWKSARSKESYDSASPND